MALRYGSLPPSTILRRFPYQLKKPGENSLKTVVEGHKPNCYVSGVSGHIKTQCPSE